MCVAKQVLITCSCSRLDAA